MPGLDTPGLLGALEQLCQEAAAERGLIASGRLEELSKAIARRQQRFEKLRSEAPRATLEDARVQALVERMHAEGSQTMTLLCSVREELASLLGRGQKARQAVDSYGRSTSL
jgi:hypothetical protein